MVVAWSTVSRWIDDLRSAIVSRVDDGGQGDGEALWVAVHSSGVSLEALLALFLPIKIGLCHHQPEKHSFLHLDCDAVLESCSECADDNGSLNRGDRHIVLVMLPSGGFNLKGLESTLKKCSVFISTDRSFTQEERDVVQQFDLDAAVISVSWSDLRLDIEWLNRKSSHIRKLNSTGSDLWGIWFTSGTTSTNTNPSAVMLRRSALWRRLHWQWNAFPAECTGQSNVLFWHAHPSFVDSLWQVLGCLVLGRGCRIVVGFNISRTTPAEFAERLVHYCVTICCAVPSLWRSLVNYVWVNESSNRPPFRLAVSSGEILSTNLALQLRYLFPSTRWINLYGCSEGAGDSTCFEFSLHCIVPPTCPTNVETSNLYSNWSSDVCPVGTPIAESMILLSNSGEILLAGSQVAIGYVESTDERRFTTGIDRSVVKAALTSRSEIEDNVSIFYTRDAGHIDNFGNLVVEGRMNRRAKMLGQWIRLDEIEARIVDATCADAAVCCLSGDPPRLCLLIESELSVDELKALLINSMYDQLYPSRWIVVAKLPRTKGSGKIDVKAATQILCKMLSEEPRRSSKRSRDVCSPAFIRIIEEFQRALGISDVSEDDDFFVLGGDSIQASILAQRLHIEVPTLYSYPTPLRLYNLLKSTEIKDPHIVSHQPRSLISVWTSNFEKCIDADPVEIVYGGKSITIVGSHAGLLKAVCNATGRTLGSVFLPTRIEASVVHIDKFIVAVGARNGCFYRCNLECARVEERKISSEPIISRALQWHQVNAFIAASYDGFIHLVNFDSIKTTSIAVMNPVRANLVEISSSDTTIRFIAATTHGILNVLQCTCDALSIDWLVVATFDCNDPLFSTPIYDCFSSTIVCCTVSGTIRSVKFDSESQSCSESWKVKLDAPVYCALYRWSSSSIMALTHPGNIHLISLESSKEIASRSIGGFVVAAAAVLKVDKDQHIIVIARTEGRVSVYDCKKDLENIEERWTTQMPGHVYATPEIVANATRIVIGCRDDHLHCFDLSTVLGS